MESWTLTITMISAPNPKTNDVNLFVSLSGDESDPKQRIPIYEDPRRADTFFFTVEKAVAPSFCLKFRIKKANSTCLEKDVSKVDVPVRDLLVKGSAGDVKPKALSYEVRSSSGEANGVLRFYCQRGPLQLVTRYPAAAAPPASKSAAAYPPPTHKAQPPPSGYLPAGYPRQTAYPPGAYPPPAAYLPWAYAPPPAAYPPQEAYAPPPAVYPPLAPYPPQVTYPYWYPAPLPAAYQPAGYPLPAYGSGICKRFVVALLGQFVGNEMSDAFDIFNGA